MIYCVSESSCLSRAELELDRNCDVKYKELLKSLFYVSDLILNNRTKRRHCVQSRKHLSLTRTRSGLENCRGIMNLKDLNTESKIMTGSQQLFLDFLCPSAISQSKAYGFCCTPWCRHGSFQLKIWMITLLKQGNERDHSAACLLLSMSACVLMTSSSPKL